MQPNSIDLIAVSSAFFLIILAEMGDKTQIMTVMLAARYRAPGRIFLGSFLGEISVSLVGIVIGTAASSVIPIALIGRISGGIFILFGLFSLVSKEKDEEENEHKGQEKTANKMGIVAAFSLVAVAELGDKTQLAVIALVVESGSPASVALGVIGSFAVTSLTGVALGKSLSHFVSTGLVQKIAAISFIVIGVILLLGLL
ncbi:MAG: TMEM165/GDT1 family protein [Thaumarchaeota archaeon]|nr:TMEM165/GDT1 family protein [Nitrososphaerota archaeon]MCL5318894.1 TMEM165/GDT1 family protein [Nitrososphaerota archaeon]